MEVVLKVEGMHCEGCENRIKNVLKTIDGIQEVDANHETKEVVIKADENLDLNEVKERLSDIGFDVTSEK